MASIRQIDANRQNAMKSTGPKTSGGRGRSSQNALRHGLSARKLAVGEEKAAELEALYQHYIEEFDPEGPAELQLVTLLTVAGWRITRAQEAEAEAFRPPIDPLDVLLSSGVPQGDPRRLEAMLRYVEIAERSWYRALSALIQLQERRRQRLDVSAVQTLHSGGDEVRHPDRADEK